MVDDEATAAHSPLTKGAARNDSRRAVTVVEERKGVVLCFGNPTQPPGRLRCSFAFFPPLIRGTPLKIPSMGGVAAGQTGWVSHQPMTHPSAGGACPSQEGNIFVKCGAARRHEISERPPLDLPLKHFARETAVVPTVLSAADAQRARALRYRLGDQNCVWGRSHTPAKTEAPCRL